MCCRSTRIVLLTRRTHGVMGGGLATRCWQVMKRRGEVLTMAERDQPWLFRTYSGHSSARASNELYRTNLSRGQTGLSVAFDLPTQIGYDADDPLAAGEVGRVGVPISCLADMETLFDGIPLEKMNTSMTINATAPWLLALYVAT